MNRQQRRAGKKQGGTLPPSARPASPPSVIEGLLLQAARLHQAGRLPEAAQLYQQILQIDPRHADALHRFGIAAHQMGRTDAALGLIGRALQGQPGLAIAHFNLGNALRAEGRLDQALAAEAAAHQPDFAEAHNNQGLAAQALGRPEELAALPADRLLHDAGPELGDFADTAALIAALDLVISVDTSVLHLAVSLGASCWGLIDFAPDWRWLTARREPPRYPSLRLFRQSRRGDWRSVAQAVRDELATLVNRRAAS